MARTKRRQWSRRVTERSNRAGRKLSAERKRSLDRAKAELRKVFHRKPAS